MHLRNRAFCVKTGWFLKADAGLKGLAFNNGW